MGCGWWGVGIKLFAHSHTVAKVRTTHHLPPTPYHLIPTPYSLQPYELRRTVHRRPCAPTRYEARSKVLQVVHRLRTISQVLVQAESPLVGREDIQGHSSVALFP